MASRALQQPDQLAPLLCAIPSLPRPILSRLVARMIERLDELDGDTDLEPNGDELDGTGSPEEDWRHFTPPTPEWGAAGCPISDPGERGCT